MTTTTTVSELELTDLSTLVLAHDLIRHAERTEDPLGVTRQIIAELGSDYASNRTLIQELLYFTYDLQGM